MKLPEQMPKGCNFYALLQSAQERASVAELFTAAGWRVEPLSQGFRLEIEWARLGLTSDGPMVVVGWVDQPEVRVVELQALLALPDSQLASQWIGDRGQLYRDLPFDPSMLDQADTRIPPDIKEGIRAESHKSGSDMTPKAKPPKPWWRFWS